MRNDSLSDLATVQFVIFNETKEIALIKEISDSLLF